MKQVVGRIKTSFTSLNNRTSAQRLNRSEL